MIIEKLNFVRVSISAFSKTRTAKGLLAAAAWQLANYAIPLLTISYLARTLGIEGFGIVGLALALVGYAALITDWGFALTATQAVAAHSEDPVTVNRIIWSTIFAKALLATACSVVICFGALFAPPTLRNALWFGTLTLIGSTLSIEWALRGMQALASFAGASIIGRLLVVPVVFLTVKSPDDAPYAIMATALGGLAFAALTLWRGARLGFLRPPAASLASAIAALRDGVHVFSSTAAISIYTNTITLGLGVVGGAAQVGLFSAAERMKAPVQAALAPISMVFFPHMSSLVITDRDAAERTARKILWVQGGLGLALSLIVTVAAPIIVPLFLGERFIAVIPILQVHAWLILVVACSNVLGLMIMLPFEMKREFSLCVLCGAGVGLVVLVPLVSVWGAMGASITALLSEIAVTLSMVFVLGRRFPWLRIGGSRSA